MTSRKTRRNSFIAVLIIISPFLWTIPTFFYLRAETRSKNTACESNLKNLGVKLLVEYPANHGGRLPDARNWIAAIRNQGFDNFRCASDPLQDRPVSYAMNANLSGKKLSDIKNPSQLILAYETNAKENIPFGTGKDMADIGKPNNGQGRHNLIGYRFNYFLMADGTIRPAGTPDEKKPLRWTP